MTTEPVLENIAQRLPDGIVSEMVFETLIVQSAPSILHQRIIFDILKRLDDTYFTHSHPQYRRFNRSGWEFTFGTRMDIPLDIGGAGAFFVPDIMGWQRQDALKDDTKEELAIEELSSRRPTWVCEVLSTNAKFDLEVKLPVYKQMRVLYIWIINPRTKCIEVHENAMGVTYTRKEYVFDMTSSYPPSEGFARISPFQEMQLDLQALFT